MKFEYLTQNKALALGDDIWFLPNPEVSSWSCQIDWYLNYQITRAENRSTTEIKLKNAPLLISTENFLNNKSTVCVHFENDITLWTLTVFKIWETLKTLSPRVFLPKNIHTEIFKKECQKLEIVKDINCSIVADLT